MFKRFYDAFRSISTLVHSITSVDEVLELVVWKTNEVLGAKGTILRILNLETEEPDLFASYGLGEKYLSNDPVSSRKMITDLCQQNKIVIIEDIATDSRVKNKKELKKDGIQMILDVPLILRTEMLGIIRVYFSERREYLDEELSFVGAVAETCACAIDKARMIEEQKSQYDQLALHTEKLSALGRMAAGIAHEINNPLAGILLYSSRMRKKVTEEGPIKEGLDVIVQETQRCKGIIQDLLEFSRDKEPEKAEASINNIIEKALGILENEFRLRHITVEKNLSGAMPAILLDVNLMQQVFVNLLINAVEAIDEDGVITIQSYVNADRKMVDVSVADTGGGIPPDDMAKIFEPFFSTKNNGTGLGLAVSYGIVQKHQGNIQVSSQLGEGTCFTVEIPLSK
jgi:signal transduction histidine kinase